MLMLTHAVGCTAQITLFGFPFSVVVAWCAGQPLSLDLQPFETAVFLVCVLGVVLIISDGRSNWLKGLALVLVYLVVAASFYFHTDAAVAAAAPNAVAFGSSGGHVVGGHHHRKGGSGNRQHTKSGLATPMRML